ncbi:MAG: haloacid dehalogenase type II [Flavisolibacter sp.]
MRFDKIDKAIKRPIFILCDVNETLLDMAPLKQKINALLSDERGFQIWFGMLLQYSLVDNSTIYHDFSLIADATLEMVARNFGILLDAKLKLDTLSTIKKLNAYPDVDNGLSMFKKAGFKLATLTNSPLTTLYFQLEHSGIRKYFDATLSIDEIKKYKPARESYLYAAKSLGVNVGEIVLMAAHGWDIAGAMNTGMQGAFVERKGQALYPLSPKPQYSGKSLVEVAEQIISKNNREK